MKKQFNNIRNSGLWKSFEFKYFGVEFYARVWLSVEVVTDPGDRYTPSTYDVSVVDWEWSELEAYFFNWKLSEKLVEFFLGLKGFEAKLQDMIDSLEITIHDIA